MNPNSIKMFSVPVADGEPQVRFTREGLEMTRNTLGYSFLEPIPWKEVKEFHIYKDYFTVTAENGRTMQVYLEDEDPFAIQCFKQYERTCMTWAMQEQPIHRLKSGAKVSSLKVPRFHFHCKIPTGFGNKSVSPSRMVETAPRLGGNTPVATQSFAYQDEMASELAPTINELKDQGYTTDQIKKALVDVMNNPVPVSDDGRKKVSAGDVENIVQQMAEEYQVKDEELPAGFERISK